MRRCSISGVLAVCATAALAQPLWAADAPEPGSTPAATAPRTAPAPGTAAPGTAAPQAPRRPAGQVDQIDQAVGLTPAQKTQIQAILQDRDQQLRAARQDKTLANRDRGSRIQAIEAAADAKIQQILTPDQQQKWQTFQNQAAARVPVDNVIRQYGPLVTFTDDQKAKLLDLLSQQAGQIRAIRNNTTLTPDQRDARLRDLEKGTQAAIQQVLTPEQQQKVQQARLDKQADQQLQEVLRRYPKDLALTDDEKTRIHAALVDSDRQMDALNGDTSIQPADRGQKLRQLYAARDAAIRAALTPDHLQQLDNIALERTVDQRTSGVVNDYTARGITLTDAQKTQVRAVVEDREKQLKAVQADASLQARDRSKKLGDIYKDSQQKLTAILTPDQQKTLADYQENHAIDAAAQAEVNRLDRDLSLTDDEKNKIKPILLDAYKKTLAVRKNTQLSGRDKADQVKQLQSSAEDQVRALLTPVQAQKLADLQAARNAPHPRTAPGTGRTPAAGAAPATGGTSATSHTPAPGGTPAAGGTPAPATPAPAGTPGAK